MKLVICSFILLICFSCFGQKCDEFETEIVQLDKLESKELRFEKYSSLFSKVTLDCPLQKSSLARRIGIVLLDLNEPSKAYGFFEESLFFAKEGGDTRYIGAAYNMLGDYYSERENYDSSLYYFNLAKENYAIQRHDFDMSVISQNLAVTHYYRNEYVQSLIYCDSLLAICEEDSNPELLNVANQVIDLIRLDSMGADIFTFQNMHERMRFYENLKDKEHYFNALENLGDAHKKIQNYDSAIFYYQKASLIAKDSLESVSNLYWMNNNISNLNEVVRLENESNRVKLMFTLFALFLIISLSLLLYINYKQKLLLAEHNLREFEKDQKLNLIEGKLKAKDDERERIGRELHDILGNKFRTLKHNYFSFEEQISNLQEQVKKQYASTGKIIDETAAEIRKISHNLSSVVLVNFGLKAALEQTEINLQDSEKPKFKWFYNNMDESLNEDVEFHVYQIILELVGNAISHSKAEEVNVQLSRIDNKLNIVFEDDGIGFDPEKDFHGMGIQNMKSRVAKMNGLIKFDSQADKGTTIIIEIELS